MHDERQHILHDTAHQELSGQALLWQVQRLPFLVYGFEDHPSALYHSGHGGTPPTAFALSFRTPAQQTVDRRITLISTVLPAGEGGTLSPELHIPASTFDYFNHASEHGDVCSPLRFERAPLVPQDLALPSIMQVDHVTIAGDDFRAILGPEHRRRRQVFTHVAFLYGYRRNVQLIVSWAGFAPYDLIALLEMAVEVNQRPDLIQEYLDDLEARRTHP